MLLELGLVRAVETALFPWEKYAFPRAPYLVDI
jgi:hypothetical protein